MNGGHDCQTPSRYQIGCFGWIDKIDLKCGDRKNEE
jgi:hypothetical protein